MDRLDAMSSFVRVAELSSFTRAAEHLGLPKASVSIQVQRLESHLGTRLFHRTTRRVRLTPDGEALYARAKALLSEVEEIDSLFATQGELHGRLRVDMNHTVANDMVIPRLPAFMQAHPGVEIELSCSDNRVDLVKEGYDCVVRVGNLEDSESVARHLGDLALINCASPEYLARHGTPHHPRELVEGHRVVHYVGQLGQRSPRWEYIEEGVVHHLDVTGSVTVNSTQAYASACVAGLGLIQVPQVGVQRHIEQGRLVEILADYRCPAMPVSLVYPHRRHVTRRLRVFMDWLGELIQTHYGLPSSSAGSRRSP